MPRITTDDLQGYGMQIFQGEQQVTDKGMPVFNGTGEPKTEAVWVFVFTLQEQGTHHVVKFTVTQAGRDDIVKALTGVAVATSLHLPDGIQL